MIHNGLLLRPIWEARTGSSAKSNTGSMMAASLTASTTVASEAESSLCTVALPSRGILRFNDSFTSTLQDTVIFESSCDHPVHQCSSSNGTATVVTGDEPFYASVAPQIYALATATVISYILVILIFITPRTFYVGGPGTAAGLHGIRNMVPGAGSSSVIGIGRRPLLQKIAATSVAISLTIATSHTFNVAESQYDDGLSSSHSLVTQVVGSLEIRISRVISDTFLWLAQVQTLIRLFPRHKEKVTIKWLGFGLVLCDTIFSILENFHSNVALTGPRNFSDAIPALSYLFQMAISLIYCSCVIYYSLSKRRFAFWHQKMRNILLVAVLSLISVLLPVVFFILDVSQPSIAVWGEYIRWVGAAAASVVVWEWVERIEALERDERKDGILGREVFDGDEMLDYGSDHKGNSSSHYFGFAKRSSYDDSRRVSMLPFPAVKPRIPFRRRKGSRKDERDDNNQRPSGDVHEMNGSIVRPPQVASPVSRSDATSAASTVYQVRYQNVSSPSPAIPEETTVSPRPSVQANEPLSGAEDGGDSAADKNEVVAEEDAQERRESSTRQLWTAVASPFKRKRAEPPAEVAAQMAASNIRRSPARTYHNVRDRIDALRSVQKGRPAGRHRNGRSPPLPVTVIPAQPRGYHSTVPGDTRSGNIQPAIEIPVTPLRESSRRKREDCLPIAVIPAPVQGARTWSPEDLQQEENRQRVTDRPAGSALDPQCGDVVTARGTLTFTESPARAREHEHRHSPANASRSSPRLRAPTVDSLNERVNSISPQTGSSGTPPASDDTTRGNLLVRATPTSLQGLSQPLPARSNSADPGEGTRPTEREGQSDTRSRESGWSNSDLSRYCRLTE